MSVRLHGWIGGYMEVKLLNNQTGIILTRDAEMVSDALYVTFRNAPKNATVIFQNENDSLYREIIDKTCEVPLSFLLKSEIISITVTILNGSHKVPTWHCERMIVTKCELDTVLIRPDDTDISNKWASTQDELNTIRENYKNLSEKYSELATKLNKLLDGYDIT